MESISREDSIPDTMTKPTGLLEAIKQTRPFESIQVEALLTLSWTEGQLSCAAHEPLTALGISTAQYNVLRILRGSPDGLETHEVVARLISRAPNITRLVDKLETKGYLTRTRSSVDRRVVTLAITPEGRRVVDGLDEPLREATSRVMAGLSPDELKLLIDLLNRLRAGAAASAAVCDTADQKESLT